jgi:hypothetical protein
VLKVLEDRGLRRILKYGKEDKKNERGTTSFLIGLLFSSLLDKQGG